MSYSVSSRGSFWRGTTVRVAMNKLLVVTVLAALLALSVDGFRMPRQAAEEQGTVTKITEHIKSYYNSAVDTVSEYVENIKGLKVEEKFKNVYYDTKEAAATYAGILQDQLYHLFYQQQ